MGDKTQLLALLLAARFRAPRPIILGILVATLLNHALAAALGAWLTQVLEPQWLRWGLGASFIAVALWMLVPDQAGDAAAGDERSRFGVFHPSLEQRVGAGAGPDAGPASVVGVHAHGRHHLHALRGHANFLRRQAWTMPSVAPAAAFAACCATPSSAPALPATARIARRSQSSSATPIQPFQPPISGTVK